MVLEFLVWTFSSNILWIFSQKRADAISGNIIWKHIYVSYEQNLNEMSSSVMVYPVVFFKKY